MSPRHRALLPLALLLGALLAVGMASAVSAAETTLTAALQGGAAEVPPGDPDGSGSATIRLDPAAGTVCWDMTTMNIAAATVSHIHEGAAGVAGPVRVNLDVDGFDGTSSGCTSGVAADQINAILGNPAGYYVNVHNADYPGGAVRGQLAAAAAPAATTAPNTATAPSDAVTASPSSLLLVLGALGLLGAAGAAAVRGRPSLA